MPLMPRTPMSKEAARDVVAATWFNASVAMAGMADSFGVPYLHVLQPNQYATKARFSDGERARFQNWTSPPVRSLVPAHYQRFLEHARDFQNRGVHFFDASTAFDDQDASVFADACCHYSDIGD